MICRKHFVKKLRELKFSFKGMTKSERHELYMRGTLPIYVDRQDKFFPNLFMLNFASVGYQRRRLKNLSQMSRIGQSASNRSLEFLS
jgi:hypothetical protein